MTDVDCRNDILNVLRGGDAFSLGDLNRKLRRKWSQKTLTQQLMHLVLREEVVRSTRVDYVRGDRLKVVTYLIRGSGPCQ